MVVTLRSNLVLVAIAVLCCLLAGLPSNLWGVIAIIWIVLFCGGFIVPSCTGICMIAVPPNTRELASAVSQISFNILGYFLAPVLSGMIMQWTHSITAGFELVMWWSILGLFGLVMALRAARKAEWARNKSALSTLTATDVTPRGATAYDRMDAL